MARITVEDCLEKVKSRFELIHLAIKRVKELRRGAPPLVECDNKEIVTALREIAAGKVYPIKYEEIPSERVEELPEPEKELVSKEELYDSIKEATAYQGPEKEETEEEESYE